MNASNTIRTAANVRDDNNTHTAGKAYMESVLLSHIRNHDSLALSIWVRDTLGACVDMTNNLKHARTEADALRAKADAIQERAVRRLADDISAEWNDREVADALTKALNQG